MKTTITFFGCLALAASLFAFHDHMGWIGFMFVAAAAVFFWFAEAYKATQIDHQPFEFECNGRVYWFKSGHVYDDEGIGEVNDAWVIAEGWKQLRERKQHEKAL